MAIRFRTLATDSMPERLHVTRELEQRFKQQEEAERATKSQASQPVKIEKRAQGQR